MKYTIQRRQHAQHQLRQMINEDGLIITTAYIAGATAGLGRSTCATAVGFNRYKNVGGIYDNGVPHTAVAPIEAAYAARAFKRR